MNSTALGIFVNSKDKFPIPIACGLCPKLTAVKVASRNANGIRIAAKYIISNSAFDCIPTTNDTTRKINTPPTLKTLLVRTAVFAVSPPLAISLVAQYDTIGLIIIAYITTPLITPHVPNSSIDNCLVTIIVNTKPVITLVKLTMSEINPEYVTLMLSNAYIVILEHIIFS